MAIPADIHRSYWLFTPSPVSISALPQSTKIRLPFFGGERLLQINCQENLLHKEFPYSFTKQLPILIFY
jgi:hypothetical protein